MAAAGAPFRGRTRERHQLDRLLDGVRGGRSAVVVVGLLMILLIDLVIK